MCNEKNRILISAEAGTSHQGSIEKGFRLIDAAAAAGADIVKFQIVFADEILHPLSGSIDLPGGKISLYENFRKLERDRDFFAKLKQYAENTGLMFMATPFGIKSAEILESLGVNIIKIASPEINHFKLLKKVKKTGADIVLSGGVSKLADIEKAVEITGNSIIFLHCITAYPAPVEEYNLKLIETLSSVFGFKTGVSDHSTDPVIVPVLSAAFGAVMIEKHITIDKSGKGLDDPIALTEAEFRQMVMEVRNAEKCGQAEIISYMSDRYGNEKVLKTIGDGVKKLAESEKNNYLTTNRSLIALRDISKGETLKENDFASLRSEKNLKPGLSPEYADFITGKTARQNIKNSGGILLEHLFS